MRKTIGKNMIKMMRESICKGDEQNMNEKQVKYERGKRKEKESKKTKEMDEERKIMKGKFTG